MITKTNVRKTITICLAAVLTLVLSLTLFACNKNKNKPADTSRQDACNEFVSAVLTTKNSSWSADLTAEQIAAYDDGGNYIVAYYWTEFVSDVLYSSDLQTAKIQQLAHTMSGENAKAFIANPEVNGGLLIPLLKEVGLTSDDVETLVYDGLVAFLNDAESVFDSCLTKVNEVLLLPSQSETARDNLNAVKTQTEQNKVAFTEYGGENGEVLSAVKDAESGLKTIAGFCFSTSMLFDSEGESDLISAIGSGALSEITLSETVTYLNSILSSVASLKDALSDEKLRSVESALGLIMDKFDGIPFGSDTFIQAVLSYVNYAYAAISYIPLVCTFTSDCGAYMLTSDGEGGYPALSALLTSFNDENYYTVNEGSESPLYYNSVIPLTQMVLAALDVDFKETNSVTLSVQLETARDYVKGILNGFSTSASGDYRKKLVLLYLDYMLQRGENATLPEADLTELGNIMVVSFMLNSFKSEYASYVAGRSENANKLNNKLTTFTNFGVTGISSSATPTSEWYKGIVTAVETAINQRMNGLISKVTADISLHADDFFAADVYDFIDIANMTVSENTSEEYQALLEAITKSGLEVFFG